MIRATLLLILILLSLPLRSDPQTSARKHRVEVRVEAGARAWPEANRWRADVFAPDGERVYQIERVVPFDFAYPALAVAGDGSGVLIDAAQGLVEFLTSRGITTATWTPFPSPQPSYERIIKCSIGNRAAAFLLSEPGASDVRVVITDLNGRVLRETIMPGSSAGKILMASDDSAVLASTTIEGDRITHLTRLVAPDGATRLELPMLFRVGDIDAASGRYAFADRYVVVGGSVKDDQPAYRSELSAGERIITAVRCGEVRALVVTEEIDMGGGTPLYRDPEVLILGGGGEILERSRLQSASPDPAALSSEGDEVVVRAGTKTARFRGIL